MTASAADRLVDDYLRRLDAAARRLPPDRAAELREEIREHIASARAAGAAADEAAVRTLLDRLGTSEEIVAAALDDVDSPGPPVPTRPPGIGVEIAAVVMLTLGSFLPIVGWLLGVLLLWLSRRWRTWEKWLGTLVVPFGPTAGLLFGMVAPRTCSVSASIEEEAPPYIEDSPPPDGVGLPPDHRIPPDGAGLPPDVPPGVPRSVEVCTGMPPALSLAISLVLFAAPIVVAVLLLIRARRRAVLEPPVPIRPSPWGARETAAVLLLSAGAVVAPCAGPIAGLVLAWTSDRWTPEEKAVATVLALSGALVSLAMFGAFLYPGWLR